MVGPSKNRPWLQAELQKKLQGWDPLMIESLLETICGSGPRSEIDDMIQASSGIWIPDLHYLSASSLHAEFPCW